mgnify:CR=1 FL=1
MIAVRVISFLLKGAYWSLALAFCVEVICIGLTLWFELNHLTPVFTAVMSTTLLQIVLYKGGQLAYIFFKEQTKEETP